VAPKSRSANPLHEAPPYRQGESGLARLGLYRRIALCIRLSLLALFAIALSSSLFGCFKCGIINAQIVLGRLIPRPCCATKPLHPFAHILIHTPSGLVTQTQIALRWRAFLFRR